MRSAPSAAMTLHAAASLSQAVPVKAIAAQPEGASEPLVRKGLKEWALAWRAQTYGYIESTDAGEAHEDGRRWWIRSVMGMSESPEHPIPRRYVERH